MAFEHPPYLLQRCPACQFENLATSRFCGQCGRDLGRTCVRCGTTNLSGARHCAACRAELPRACPQCHALNLPSSHFCSTCAYPLRDHRALAADATGGRRERRKVSVLFADISGFTALSTRMDPEEIYVLVDQALRHLASQVDRFGGTVDKFTGDGLMAIFGAPTPLEQHALHAVWAAMAMQEAIRAFNEEARAKYGTEIRLRIGINAGEVVAGEVGTDHFRAYTVIGDTVNLAARLEHAAQPGHILVSEAVQEATRAYIEYRELPELHLKGYPVPVRAYEVRRARVTPGRARGLSIPGLVAPLVGREEELKALEGVTQCLGDGRRGVVLVVGEAGIGKSRLLAEYLERLPFEHTTISTGCYEHTHNVPYGLFGDLLKRYFGVPFGQDPATTRRQVETRLRRLVPDRWEELVPFILHLLATDVALPTSLEHLSPQQLKQRVFGAVAEFLRAEARSRPLVLVLEDLHWADDLSAELVEHLIVGLEEEPVLFCCSSRSARSGERDWHALLARAAPGAHRIVELAPLSPEEVDRLLDLLLDRPELPARLRQDIVAYSEGIPLYLEELLRALIEASVLVREEGRWRATTEQALEEIAVPRTVEEIVMARYARLAPSLREVLGVAAVIGRRVPFRLLEECLESAAGAEPLMARVEALVEARFLQRLPDAPTLEYTFQHRIAHGVIYNSLLVADRQALHLRVAQALERLSPPDSDDYVEMLAHHYARSAEPERALPYLIRAGQKAAARYANHEAIAFFERARALTAQGETSLSQLVAIESGLGDVLSFVGRYEEARAAYRRALEAVTQGDGARRLLQASLWRRIGTTFERQGLYAEALEALRTAHGLLQAEGAGDEEAELAATCSDIGWVLFRMGQFDGAHQWLTKALELARRSSQAVTAAVLNRLGGLAFQRRDLKTAVRYTREALAIREALGHLDEIARTNMNLAVLHSVQGLWQDALDFYQQAAQIQERIGDYEGLALAFINTGMLYTLLGRFTEANVVLTKAKSLADRLDSRFLQTWVRQTLAQLYMSQEAWDSAERELNYILELENQTNIPLNMLLLVISLKGETAIYLDKMKDAMTLAEQLRSYEDQVQELDPTTTFFLHRFYGLLAEAQGDYELARIELQKSYEIETEAYRQARLLVELARVEAKSGRVEEAAHFLAQAEEIVQKLGARGEAKRIERLKAELGLPHAPSP